MISRDKVTRLQGLSAGLHESQELVTVAVERISASVQRGALAAAPDLALLEKWQTALGQAAAALAAEPGEITLSALEEAIAASLRDLAAQEESATLQRILDEIAAAPLDSETMPLLGKIIQQARTADSSGMPEETRDAFRALHRMLSKPLSAVDPQDAEVVRQEFGWQAALASASASLSIKPVTTAPEVPPGAPSAPPARAATPEVLTEPEAAVSEPVPAEPVAAQAEPVTIPAGSGAASAGESPAATARPQAIPVPTASPAGPAAVVPASMEPPSTLVAELEGELASGPPDERIAEALAQGCNGLAYWYTVALQLPATVQSAFEVLALSEAIMADGDECSVRIREVLNDFDVTSVAQNSEYLKILAAGSARALLRMPFSPCADTLQDAAALIADGGTSAFLTAVLHAAAFGLELGKLEEVQDRSPAEFVAHRDSTLQDLSSAMEAAKNSKTRYARATSVWRRFISEKGPLGGPVCTVLNQPDDLEAAEDLLASLRDQRAIDRMIDIIDKQLNPIAARRSKIVAGARDELRGHASDLLDALRAYVEAARAVMSRQRAGTSDQLGGAVESLTRAAVSEPEQEPDDAGDQAVAHVKYWLRDVLIEHAALPDTQQPIATVLARDLARCFELQRLGDGTVVAGSVTPEILGRAQRPVLEAYEGFVAADDHIGAEQLIDVLRTDGDEALADQLSARRQEDLKVSRERLRKLLTEAERELDRALYEALLSESKSAEMRAELERLRTLDVVDFTTAKKRLRDIIDEIAKARDDAIEDARQQLQALELATVDRPEEVRARIHRQLEAGDLVNAQEFLAQLAMGAQGLPAEAPADETLTRFWPSFVNEVAARAVAQPHQASLQWLEDAAAGREDIAGLSLARPDSGSIVRRGLSGWLDLTRNKRGGSGWQQSLKDVLNLLGLEVKGSFEPTPYQPQRWWTKFQATPVGQALVPTYGSVCAGRYQLMLCWEKTSPDRLVELLAEKRPEPPVLALYFNTLAAKERHRLAEYSRPHNKNISAVVIDNAVIAFLASRTEARLQTTMGITLPFTAINPYTPFALGDVPREVFYGRKEELRRVQDANDALFVYGGRQLGKSALLKTAMREFAETDDRWRSIYVDLKADGVGEWREPDDLWPVILPHLQRAGIVDAKVSSRAPASVVVDQIRRWLEGDHERRILLLLDEADAFLETDARARSGLPGEGRFINVYHLKGLMDGSSRRFKPVFAGLHQVQRFHSASNGPMAHVGAEIPVGPLPPPEAYKLLVKPLAAIGYRFERPDVAWRLLAYTNYHASLIQHFCRALVDRLHHRSLGPEAPPTIVSDRDIDGIYIDKEVRDLIATRFELTINLDNRYRVIAYATASLTLSTDSQVFPTITLYDECKTFWPAGFAGLSLDDFSAYLDEMVGLGILVRTRGDEYGIRSPNVIRLLGAPEEIERRLLECEFLELSRPFDPAMFRRALGGNPNRRSPLAEQQVQQILNGRDRVHVVVGSAALGIDRVAEALREAAPEDMDVRAVSCDTLHEEITSLTRAETGPHHLVLDLGDVGEPKQRAALQHLHKWMTGARQRRTVSCLAPLSADWIWQADVPGVPVERVRIRPWTHDSLRAWAPECEYPLGTAEQRARLLEATGGWPRLVETAATSAARGAPEARACADATAFLTSGQAESEFLLDVGLSASPVADEVAETASKWSEELAFDDLATLIEANRETVLVAVTRLIDLGVLGYGSSGDTYVINPLIATLLRNE